MDINLPLQIWGVFFLTVMATSIASQVLLTLPEFRVSTNSFRNSTTIKNPKMHLFLATGKEYSVLCIFDFF